ncbi:MAG: IS1595 family transposase [Acidobacteriaceae bacterium]|nr:IS1595 family transposase [Acidobacteriaceae bacterium]MBV9778375.1 IS1595 family transposase [Acidobacteriaceae bacterium]
MNKLPETLQEAILYFTDQDNAIEFVRDIRWPDGVECPTCGSKEVIYLKNQRRWKCKHDHSKQQFSVKVGTIFEDSPIGLDKWLPAAWLITTCKNGISSYELAKDLKVTQKTAWFMLHRVRLAMKAKSFEKLSGEVEADECFIGGKVRNMHKHSKRRIKANNDGNWGKTVVLGLLERQGHVRAMVAPNRRNTHVHAHVLSNVELGSALYTDEADMYKQLNGQIVHEFVDHISTYVQGRVHINGMENFWSLLKRTLGGTYVSVDPMHLFRYLDEQCFRYNFRKLTDQEKFMIVIAHVIGQRLTYAELTGKTGEKDPI